MSSNYSSTLCLRCLGRTIRSGDTGLALNASQHAAFSTSRSLGAAPLKKKVTGTSATVRRKTLTLTKNVRASGGKPPEPGERKAMRKRIELGNVNAIEIQGMEDLRKDSISSEKLRSLEGQVIGLQPRTVESLKALQGFKHTQGWNYFRRPAVLVRRETVSLAQDFEKVAQLGGEATVRRVLSGEQGSGKSILQLQAMAMALHRGWVVIHIPETAELTIAHTAYEPITTPDGIKYIQPDATADLLKRIAEGNKEVLSKLRLSKAHKLPVPLKANATLEELVEIGARNANLAWPVWNAFWSEITAPSQAEAGDGQRRPKVLFSLDGLGHAMRNSSYLNRDAEPVHAHDLALISAFLSALSGRTPLPNGGIILGATSGSNVPSTPTLNQCIAQQNALQEGKEQSPVLTWDAYTLHDDRVRNIMKDVSVQKVHGLSKSEARGIMEYYAQSGLLRASVTESLVSEKWTVSGGGIIGQIEKASVRTRF